MDIKDAVVGIIIALILLGFFLVYVINPEGGLLGKAKSAVLNFVNEKWQDILPGGNVSQAEETEASAEQSKAISSMEKSIQRMLDSQEKNCFVWHDELPALGRINIEFIYYPERGATDMIVRSGVGIVEEKSFAEMIPCVIAGEDVITENFEKSFINEKSVNEKIIIDNHFNRVMRIKIAEDDGGYWDLTENRIDYGSGFKDFESFNYLYTPDKKHICFFSIEDGISIYAFVEKAKDSILRQVSEGRLKSC